MAACYCAASPQLRLLRHPVTSPSALVPSSSLSTVTPPSSPLSLAHRRIIYRNRYKPFSSFSSSSTRLVSVTASRKSNDVTKIEKQEEVAEVEEEEDVPWIQEKALDLVEFTGSVTQAIPGPRVGSSSLPWILAVPMAYIGITFVMSFVKTVRKFNSPKELRRKLVNKNVVLCKSIDALFEEGRDAVQQSALKGLMQKTGFNMEEILRKYIRYALNEKPFNPDLVANLIQLRKASMLDDSQVTEILNEISRRIVKDKGPVVMDMSGYSEKGFKRKLAVQALFGKVYYLSESEKT
ncbi:uncharacterized protein LOC132303114 isoform X2 [Cornus florida]|uniref:uncharacterized protein LOC132303114 isoform X2 n=1 Tax=Cornus florida TaxID=4283 RepID=UPI002896BF2D|nr:uncharacterized protein LOC132303114 isoform X2 [Cornus florida]